MENAQKWQFNLKKWWSSFTDTALDLQVRMGMTMELGELYLEMGQNLLLPYLGEQPSIHQLFSGT